MFRIVIRIFWVLSLLVLGSIFISPQDLWISGLLSLLIPLVLIAQTLFLGYFLWKRSKSIIYPLSILILGLLFLNRTISIHGPLEEDGSFSMLSYNVRVFNVYSHLNNDYQSSKQIIKWSSEQDVDIKCFQEFYHDGSSETFNTVKALLIKTPYYYFEPNVTNSIGAEFGMAIFSKYPIIDRGHLNTAKSSSNDILFADIDLGTDTIRVYNVHLESMSIDENRLVDSNSETIKKNLGVLMGQFKHGFINRARQIEQLCDHLQQSPHPVLLAGDLNDVPYSYSYQKLKRYLHSSFENAGNGFGFTFNGKLFFLRIDNQFYGERLNIHEFNTHRQVNYTDHFPISAVYSLD